MHRQESLNKNLLGELTSWVDGLEPGRSVLPGLVQVLREGLRAERTVAYGVDVGPEQYLARFCHGAGFAHGAGAVGELFNGFLSTLHNPWGYFDPARPVAAQRNRALHFRPLMSHGPSESPLHDVGGEAWRKLGIAPEERARVHGQVHTAATVLCQRLGVERMFELRTLVCDGSAMLAWVGAFRSEPFGPQEVRLLQALTPVLQRRLGLEERLRESGLLGAALEAAMEALSQPAYVLTGSGRVVYANSAGRARMGHAAPRLAELRHRTREQADAADLVVTPLRGTGLSAHSLVIDRSASSHAFARVHALAGRWALTAREVEVLERIIHGETNKAIAARLGCAERTVEVHVTHVLCKAQVESRSALIAKFFQAA
ncbi:LuxR family transcriptional regulator [Myxococcaceae bacterium GXIMD 01537]